MLPSAAKPRALWVIALTFILAFTLTALPLPAWLAKCWPPWVAMALIYWCMALPERVGIGIAWLLGLLMDAQTGALLGQNALAYSLLAWIVLAAHRRLRVAPRLQQALLVGGYVLLLQFFTLWIRGMIGMPLPGWSFLLPVFAAMLLWPRLFTLLRGARRRFRVS